MASNTASPIGGSALTSLWRLSGTQLEVAELLRMEGWPYPCIVLAVPQQMPDDHSELAGDCDRADVVAAAPGDLARRMPGADLGYAQLAKPPQPACSVREQDPAW
jgi:hypothetical protein